MTTSYKAEVTTTGDYGKYSCNALRFATREEANEYGRNLMFRWMAVEAVRVAESDTPVNAQWVDLKVVHLT